MTNIVIASAGRTAVGSFLGSFANTPAHDLGAAVLEGIVERAGIEKGEVSETILGQVLTAGQGQNPARQAHINAGLPIESRRLGCQSGLWLGLAGGGIGGPAHHAGRCRNCGGWRSGKHVAFPPCRQPAQRSENGGHAIHRQHDPRRAVGCL